jgi:hypothetical protein
LSEQVPFSATGSCTCGQVRYRLARTPLIVHCCHCHWCQRETGSAFVVNAMIDTAYLERSSGAAQLVATPSNSGRGQQIARCPTCQVALWSHYAGMGQRVSFVRVGTLDRPDLLPPDVHIYTESKLPWVIIPQGAKAYPQYYDRKVVWSEASLQRRLALIG